MVFLGNTLPGPLSLLLLALLSSFFITEDYIVSCVKAQKRNARKNFYDVTFDAVSRYTTISPYHPFYKDGSSESYKVQYVTHTILGQHAHVKSEFIGFTSRLLDARKRKENDVMVYVVRPLGEPKDKNVLFSEFQTEIQFLTQQSFNVTFPIFEAGLKWSKPSTNLEVNFKSVANQAEYLKSSIDEVDLFNRPFYVYLVDVKTLKKLSDIYVTQVSAPSKDTAIRKNISEDRPSSSKVRNTDSDLNFSVISYASERLFEKAPFSREPFVSPVGLSYILANALPFVNVSTHSGKEIVGYVSPETAKIPDSSIHKFSRALSNKGGSSGYFFYSPTFQAPGVESKVGKFIQDAEVEHTNDFMNFEKVKLGLHGLHLNYSGLRLDSDAHTFMHYFNLEGWYWSTPFKTEDVGVIGIVQKIKGMTAVVDTTFIVDNDSPMNERYKAFKLNLQNIPPSLSDPGNNSIKASKSLSVYIIFNYFSDDDRDTIPLLSTQRFTQIRLKMLRATPKPYHVRMAIFSRQTYYRNFTSTQFPRLFSDLDNGFTSLVKDGLVELSLEQCIHLCVTKHGLGVSALPTSAAASSNSNEGLNQILVFSPFYFIVFDEIQETVISSTLIERKDFAREEFIC